jgi:hypothetical protein
MSRSPVRRTTRFLPPACAATLAAIVAGGCAPARSAVQPQEAVPVKQVESSRPGGVANLPFARGRTFATLDEYLAYRRSLGATDVPWYREVRPGVYELVSRRPHGAEPQTFTRQELLERFGFRE